MLLYRYLDSTGDGLGIKNIISDHSGAPVEYYVQPSGFDYLINRIIVSYEDASGGTSNEYGNIGVALTNGITIQHLDEDDNVLVDVTDGVPIKTNGQWSRLAGPDVEPKTWGAGPELWVVRFTFGKAGAALRIPDGHRLAVQVNDDFTGLISQYVQAQGRR